MQVCTFGTDVSAGNAHFDLVLFHFHLVAGTRTDTRAVIHYEVIWRNSTETWVAFFLCSILLDTGLHGLRTCAAFTAE